VWAIVAREEIPCYTTELGRLEIAKWNFDGYVFDATIIDIAGRGCGKVEEVSVMECLKCLCNCDQRVSSDVKLMKNNENQGQSAGGTVSVE
jgi:sRNA-binding protein